MGMRIQCMDSAQWQMYGRTSTIGVLAMSCDGGGARVGEGLQCWLIKGLG